MNELVVAEGQLDQGAEACFVQAGTRSGRGPSLSGDQQDRSQPAEIVEPDCSDGLEGEPRARLVEDDDDVGGGSGKVGDRLDRPEVTMHLEPGPLESGEQGRGRARVPVEENNAGSMRQEGTLRPRRGRYDSEAAGDKGKILRRMSATLDADQTGRMLERVLAREKGAWADLFLEARSVHRIRPGRPPEIALDSGGALRVLGCPAGSRQVSMSGGWPECAEFLAAGMSGAGHRPPPAAEAEELLDVSGHASEGAGRLRKYVVELEARLQRCIPPGS